MPHYWIVDPDTETVIRFALNQLTYYADPAIAGMHDWLALPFAPSVPLAVATLFA